MPENNGPTRHWFALFLAGLAVLGGIFVSGGALLEMLLLSGPGQIYWTFCELLPPGMVGDNHIAQDVWCSYRYGTMLFLFSGNAFFMALPGLVLAVVAYAVGKSAAARRRPKPVSRRGRPSRLMRYAAMAMPTGLRLMAVAALVVLSPIHFYFFFDYDSLYGRYLAYLVMVSYGLASLAFVSYATARAFARKIRGSSWARVDPPALLRRSTAAVLTGLAASTVALTVFFLASNGRDPDFACDFVPGDAGLLPLNPGFGDTRHQEGDHSCDPNILGFAAGVIAPAMLISVVTFLILAALAWPRPPSDPETP